MMADARLSQDVLAALSWYPSVTATDLTVTARDRIVTLTGHVDSFAQKNAAEAVSCRVKGVKAVAGEIAVDLAFDHRRTDADIAAAKDNRLDWDAAILPVTAQVQDGWVALDWAVDGSCQRDAAALDVRSPVGVVGLSNRITIKPRTNARDIAGGIEGTLGRSCFFDPRCVGVDMHGDRVLLTSGGHIDHQRRLAGATARSSPGVAIVENDLAIV